MNGLKWSVVFVDPYSSELIDRTNVQRVATTDPLKRQIFLSRSLQGEFLQRVLTHELGHAAMISYGLLDEIHLKIRPRFWMEMEEWICNFMADYGPIIFKDVYSILNNRTP